MDRTIRFFRPAGDSIIARVLYIKKVKETPTMKAMGDQEIRPGF